MGIKRIVDTGFWTDGKTEDFTPEDKYFMVWLLTNPFTTQLGIYSISIKQSALQLGYSEDTVKYLLERFDKTYGVIIYSKDTKEVAVKNFLRHSIIKGGKPVEDCIKKEMTKVKNKNLIYEVFKHISPREDLNDTVRKIINEYEIDNDNDNDNENDVSYHDSYHDSCKSIIFYLNEKTDSNYKLSTKKTQTCIHARLKEGFTEEDFKMVIDKKCAEWIGTEWEKYLRPETLFGTKFESYLNAKVTKKPVNTGMAQNVEDPLANIKF